MKEFLRLLQLIGEALPDLVSLILCPALLLAVGLVLAVFHKKKAYLPVAAGLGGAAAFLVGCEVAAGADICALFAYAAAYLVLAALVTLLFLIPFPVRKGDREREEEMYERFRVPLEVPAEESGEESAEEESGVHLEHALNLLGKLKQCALSPSDRLETDTLGERLESYRGHAPSAEEVRQINDCLATILKLTAKYKL